MSGDRVERGPGHWRVFERDAGLARCVLGANAFRFSIEWSRIFPRSTARARTPRQLDKLAPPCPTTCTDFGWEIYPEGFCRVLRIAGGYGTPIYVTENGLADAHDDLRAT